MKLSVIDDGPEVAVDVHLEDPPAQVSSIKTRIKSLATGVWDLLKRLTEYMAPTVVKTPATSATAEVLDPEVDPDDFGLSVLKIPSSLDNIIEDSIGKHLQEIFKLKL